MHVSPVTAMAMLINRSEVFNLTLSVFPLLPYILASKNAKHDITIYATRAADFIFPNIP